LSAQWLTYDGDTLQQGGVLNENLTLDGNGHSYTISNALGISLNSNSSSGFTVAETAALSLKAGSANQVQINGLGSSKTVNIHADSTQQRMDDGISVIIDAQNNDTWATYEIGANATTTAGGTYQPLLLIEQDGSVTINGEYTLPTADGTTGQILQTDGAGNATWEDAGSADNLGNHTATQILNMSGFAIQDPDFIQWDDANADTNDWSLEEDGTNGAFQLELDFSPNFQWNEDKSFGNTNYTFPAADGTSNQVLQTNGSGTISWASISGGADNLGNHIATASLNMNGNEIDSISILNLFDTNGDGTYWTAFEDASGNLIVQSSDAGTDDFTLQPDGDLIITGQLTNNNTWSLVGTAGSSGQYLKSNGDGTTAWDTPAGGSGGGTTEYYFGGQSTQSVDTTLTQDTWEPIRLANEVKKDASFTHSTTVNSHEITLDSTGVYVLSYSVQLNSNAATRMDILTRAQIDTGGGYATLPGSWGALGTFPFAATAIDQFGISVSGIMFSATAGDKIKVEVNVDNENGGDLRFEAGSKVMLQRIE